MIAEQFASHYADVRRRITTVHTTKPVIPDPPQKLPLRWQNRISAKEIIIRVSRWHRVPVAAIMGPSRIKRIVAARQCAMYWIRRRCLTSLKETSKKVGRSDHSTALHGIQSHIDRRARRNRERNNA